MSGEIKRAPDGYDICPECGHHTSAAVAGHCTVFVPDGEWVKTCDCDCYKAIHGESLSDVIAQSARTEVAATPDPAARVLDAAIAVARRAPKRRGQYVSSALVYWPLIEELRAALDALGVEWRVPR